MKRTTTEAMLTIGTLANMALDRQTDRQTEKIREKETAAMRRGVRKWM